MFIPRDHAERITNSFGFIKGASISSEAPFGQLNIKRKTPISFISR
jgi:hypothetical protein